MEHVLKGVDPRVELQHFQSIIADRRKALDLEGVPISAALLLDPPDRLRYLLCLSAVKMFEVMGGTRGIVDIHDMVEHIELVSSLSLAQAEVTPLELRGYSLDLLRSMNSLAPGRRVFH